MNRGIHCLMFVVFAITNTHAYAQDRVDLEGATIIGNRELPKILYVVPWKLPDQDHIISRPITRQTSADLAPINRGQFHNLLELHGLRQDKTP